MDYSVDLLVSWSRDLSYTIGFARNRFYLILSVYRFYVSLGDIWCCLVYFIYRLFICSYHLYHACSQLDINYCVSTYSCMLVLMTRFTMHIMTRFHRYTYAYLCTPFAINITTRRGVLTPLGPHVQVSEFGLTWIFLPKTKLTFAEQANQL